MKLRDIGEFGLIDRIAKGITVGASVVRGIGDDAAVLRWTRDRYLLATVDMLIEGVHFRRSNSRPEQVGWKAICCGASDIAAMGGVPQWALVSCGLPKDLGVVYIDKLYAGMKKAARRFGIDLVGGDTNSSSKIILDIMVLGCVKKSRVVYRSGAKVNDFIFVTGALGGSIRGRHLDFVPRLKESQKLLANFKVHSMIDISDGLSNDLFHIARESGVGALLYEDLIPLSPAARDIEAALHDGEDFELLFTMSKQEGCRLLDTKETLFDMPIRRIGTVTEKQQGVAIVDRYGRRRILAPQGFTHF